MRSCKQRNSVK